jgi:hypothetical protein
MVPVIGETDPRIRPPLVRTGQHDLRHRVSERSVSELNAQTTNLSRREHSNDDEPREVT